MNNTPTDYGLANKFDFDNPSKWHTVADVPILDEHQLTNEAGHPIAEVDRSVLEEIASNRNRDVYQKASPATLILGHTSDDPRAPEKPAKGFAVNFKVKPFRRDPDTGKVIYSIFTDYKFKHQNKHIADEYPNRSVELWWHKKDINPIALLGGTTPERDLGVIIRNARLNNIALHPSPVSTNYEQLVRRDPSLGFDPVIRFHKRGDYVIENYSIDVPLRFSGKDQNGKMGKVMSEFKHGTLHSGSKSGPKVTDRKQAQAIGESEARKHKMSGSEHTMNGSRKYEEDCDDGHMKYEDGLLNTQDVHDGGDEGPDGADGGGADDSSPVMNEVMQSKAWKDLSSKLDMILSALTEGQGDAGDGMGGPGGPGQDGLGGEEMPPPQDGGTGGQAPPPGAEGMGDEPPMDGEEPNPDDEDRLHHGQAPVKMESTGFPGASNTYIPGVNSNKSQHRMSRGTSMNGTTRTRGQRTELQVKLERQDREIGALKMENARAHMERELINCVNEGVLFGRDQAEHEANLAEELEHLTQVYYQRGRDEAVGYVNEVIRKRYSRRASDPARPAGVGLARFSRDSTPPEGATPGSSDDFDPQSDQQVTELADLTYKHGEEKAIKMMRSKYGLDRRRA